MPVGRLNETNSACRRCRYYSTQYSEVLSGLGWLTTPCQLDGLVGVLALVLPGNDPIYSPIYDSS